MESDLVVDTSAVLAILLREPGFEGIELGLASSKRPAILTSTVLESTMVFSRFFCHSASRELAALLGRYAEISVHPFDEECSRLATEAFLRFGKGRHPASLNFGDCMVFGLAAKLNVPVLCTGDDFRQTDLRVLP